MQSRLAWVIRTVIAAGLTFALYLSGFSELGFLFFGLTAISLLFAVFVPGPKIKMKEPETVKPRAEAPTDAPERIKIREPQLRAFEIVLEYDGKKTFSTRKELRLKMQWPGMKYYLLDSLSEGGYPSFADGYREGKKNLEQWLKENEVPE